MYFYHRTVMVWIRSCAYLFVWAQLQYLTLSLCCARYYHIYPEGTPDPVYYTWSIVTLWWSIMTVFITRKQFHLQDYEYVASEHGLNWVGMYSTPVFNPVKNEYYTILPDPANENKLFRHIASIKVRQPLFLKRYVEVVTNCWSRV